MIPRGPAARLAAGSGGAGQSDASGPDLYGDQEILARPALWQPWTFSAAAGGDWQSNAALAPNWSGEDYVFRQSASARYTRKLSNSWYADFRAAQQIARYDKFDILDYDRVDADAGILWKTSPANLSSNTATPPPESPSVSNSAFNSNPPASLCAFPHFSSSGQGSSPES